jgi:hypothetical protein
MKHLLTPLVIQTLLSGAAKAQAQAGAPTSRSNIIKDRAHSIPGPREHGFDHYLCQNEEPPLRTQMGAERRLYTEAARTFLAAPRDRSGNPARKN